MKKLVLAGFALALLAAPAGAADVPAAPVYKAPVIVPVHDWSGFYVGVSLGARWASVDNVVVSFDGGPPSPGHFNTARNDSTAFRAGGYAGYNWQFSPNWLVGVEADVAWGNGRSARAQLIGAIVITPGDNSEYRQRWDAGLRARLGMLVTPAWLLYMTGGVAWQNFEASSFCPAVHCIIAITDSFAATHTGWTIGGGIEGMLWGNWLVRAEYRYADYGSFRNTHYVPTVPTVIETNLTTSTALIGLAYKFGGPVVARY